MKCYTIAHGTAEVGINVNDGHIILGEHGRGRKQMAVPVPADVRIERSERGNDRIVSADGPDGAAMVYIVDHSGYRGGWHLRRARSADEWALLVAKESDATIEVPPERLDHDAAVIGRGECAQGAAGRMGGGPEYLLIMPHGCAVEIVRSGRLYGSPSCFRVECDAGEVVVTVPREVARSNKAKQAWIEATQSKNEENTK